MLVAEHKSLVTQVEKLADPQYWSDDNKEDRLLNLSYGEPPRTSSGLSFHGGASPIPIPIPAPASSIPDPSLGSPSLLEGSSDKENSTPGTQQSIVTELVAIVEEEHLDIGGESGHMMACQVQDELVCSVLGVRNMVFFKLFPPYFYDFSFALSPPHSFLSVSLFQEKTIRVLLIP